MVLRVAAVVGGGFGVFFGVVKPENEDKKQ